MGTTNFRVDVSVPAGAYSHLVLGLATRGRDVCAVGGQRSDLFVTSTDGAKFVPGRSLGRGLRGAWWNEHGIWVVGEYGYAARSSDAGVSWTPIKSGTSGCLFGVVEDGDGTFWLAGDGGHLARSTDGGATFKRVKGVGESIARIATTSIGVLIPGDAPGHLYLAKGNKVAKLGLTAGVDLMNATVTREGTIVVVGAGGAVFRSEDEGASFERVDMSACGESPIGVLAGVDVLHDGRLISVGERGLVVVSDDDGKTFARVPQHASNTMLWCVKRYGAGAIIGGAAGLVFRVTDPAAKLDETLHANRPGPIASKAPATIALDVTRRAEAEPVHAAWRALAPSVERQDWTPTTLPVERIAGVFWTPELRAILHPRRGGVKTDIRPLPTVPQAWARLRRAAWASDRSRMDAKKARSGIWSMMASHSLLARAVGERLADPSPRSVSEAEDVELVALCFGGYRSFTYQFSDDLQEGLADLLVAQCGLPEALRRALMGLEKELPYTTVGPFGRLRELAVVADERTYADARKVAVETLAAENVKSRAKSYVDEKRIADLRWAATFVFPISAGMPADAEERSLHAEALVHVGEFGNAPVHACGLAAGHLDTLECFLAANSRVRHEFFSSGSRRYLASILDIAGAEAARTLVKMKPSPPFADSAPENLKWCQLLAHIDDDEALTTLVRERRGGGTWGTASLLCAARFNFDRVMTVAKALEERDAELVAMVEHESGRESEAPPWELEDLSIAAMSIPGAYEPPPAARPRWLDVPVALAPELTWRDDERTRREDRPAITWNDRPLDASSAESVEAFVAHQEKWALPTSLEVLVATPPRVQERLLALGFALTYWDLRAWMPSLLLERGASVVPAHLAALQESETFEDALAVAQPVGEVSFVPSVALAFAGKKNKAAARSWLLRHPRHAALGAVALLTAHGVDVESRDADLFAAAERVLRFLDSAGHRDVIDGFADTLGVATKARVRDALERDPLSAPKVKRPVLPGYAASRTLTPLQRIDGEPTRDEDVERLLVELAFSNADEVHPGVLAAKRIYTVGSRAAFAWALFSAWLGAGAEPKETWCMQALGHFGDDECARRLSKLAKEWPGQQASARAQAALDALVNIGTDAALSNIALLAEKSKFPKFKQAAKTRIDAIADARGLTTDELADRLVPTLGLDEAGADQLDFGPRKFRIVFDERLAPIVVDERGERYGDLPKPGKLDDKPLAKEAKAKLAGLKKDARTTASLQLARLERAMRSARRIDAALFVDAFANHPWMRHVAQRLVWGALDRAGALVATFRVAEDGTLADIDDRMYTLPPEAAVSVVHPIQLPEGALARWSTSFAELTILQPFPQLARPVSRPTDAERGATRLTRFAGRAVTAVALRGLESRGWDRWIDVSVGFAKRLDGHTRAFLATEPGWHPSQGVDDVEPQRLESIDLEGGRTLGSLEPIAFSELIFDVDSILTQP